MAAKFEQRTAIAYRALRRRVSLGATMTEYALLLVAVLIIATAVVKTIRPSVNCNGLMSVGELPGDNSSSNSNCGGGTAVASNGSSLGGSENDYTGGASGSSGSASNGSSTGSATGGSSSGSGSSSGGSSSGSGAGNGGSIASSSNGGSNGGNAGATNSNSAADPHVGPSFASQVAGIQPKKLDLTLGKISENVKNADIAPETTNGIKPIDGFLPLTKAELAKANISPDDLHDESTGFKAVIYKDSNGDYVIGFKDSQNGKDAWTDAKQVVGVPPKAYYEADKLAAKAKLAFGPNLVGTGHSLGGAEAAVTALHYGFPAVTQNAAGVHDNTLMAVAKQNPWDARAQAANGQVRNEHLDGELVNASQSALWLAGAPQSLGRQVTIPDQNANRFGLFSPSHSYDNHGIDTFNKNLAYDIDHGGVKQ
jgi:hypothetical protein